ncbi:MAG: polyprenyl synthetase family protein [Verrucomicrobia bacterium]|nr:polyprenyl synthetase family protein [Verrucomicrobiota bacterium]
MPETLLKNSSTDLGKFGNSHFFFHRDRIEQEIAKNIYSFGEKTKLRDAIEYAILSGGKRFRPLVVILIAEALGNNLSVYEAALSVEFFHTASLIVDDLPCMDNDDERREKPTLHKVFGESIALLASYALMTAGYDKIYRNALVMQESDSPFSELSDRVCSLALETATRCAGIHGATGGQFLDLFPPNHNLETIKLAIYKKTVTLFEVSFLFGWLFGGGDLKELEKVKKVAYHFGMAFQTADDLGDMLQDEKKQREMSIARLIGRERALLLFDEEMRQFRKTMQELGILTPSFEKMSDILVKYAIENAKSLS